MDSHPFALSLSLLFSIVLMADNHKALLESLITNQGPLNGSYETHWPFNAEDTARRAGRLTDSRANFLVGRFALRNTRWQIYLVQRSRTEDISHFCAGYKKSHLNCSSHENWVIATCSISHVTIITPRRC